MKVDTSIVPDSCTKYMQVPDISWNKPSKQKVTDLHDEWLANKGLHQEKPA